MTRAECMVCHHVSHHMYHSSVGPRVASYIRRSSPIIFLLNSIPVERLTAWPASYIGHVVSNGMNFNLPVRAVGVNVGMNLTNMNLKLAPRAAHIRCGYAHLLTPHMHAHSPTPQMSPPCGGRTPKATPSLHQQQVVSRSGTTY